ncbi:GroES-like protein [Amniculicola lignicola CBS 123094]|uniref:GroES-like protein n=1 Tax=Amniculicola lignicola CBS 123094 TaxID=1392246 RepID=A0A6A5WKC4_9PLEO|nr:GroES-like protein [Amniculicola lignicola CBS 123094]
MTPAPNSEYTVYRGVEGAVKKSAAQLPALGPKDILVKITHSGLCGTDLAFVPYGIALGHEGVGIVEAVGSEVTQFKVGERAGGGYHRNSCGHCSYCLTGQDIWCYERSVYGEKDYHNGTFGEYYIGVETYLHKIPEGLASEHAAPLQCAGATVYNAISSVVKPGERVGILGIGGLGHLAIQFARKLGTEVVVFSTSKNKEQEAKDFGATEFYLLDELEKLKAPVNTLVVAGNTYPDWKKFLVKDVLARAGNIIPLAAPNGDLSLPAFQMFFDGYNVRSSLVASRAKHDEMLEFAAVQGVKPWVEKFDLTEDGLLEAITKMKGNKMRYRGVLVAKDV